MAYKNKTRSALSSHGTDGRVSCSVLWIGHSLLDHTITRLASSLPYMEHLGNGESFNMKFNATTNV